MIPSALYECTDTSKAKGHIVTTVIPTVFVLSKNLTLPDNRKRELCTYIWGIPVLRDTTTIQTHRIYPGGAV